MKNQTTTTTTTTTQKQAAALIAAVNPSLEITNEGGLLAFPQRYRGVEAFVGNALIDGDLYSAAIYKEAAAVWKLLLKRGNQEILTTLGKNPMRATNPRAPFFIGRVEMPADFFKVALWVKPTAQGGFFISGVFTPEISELFRDIKQDGGLVTAALHEGSIIGDIMEEIHNSGGD